MRVPLSWLREYVDVPADATTDDVFAALVSVGFEEEEALGFEVTGPVVVGQVLDIVGGLGPALDAERGRAGDRAVDAHQLSSANSYGRSSSISSISWT